MSLIPFVVIVAILVVCVFGSMHNVSPEHILSTAQHWLTFVVDRVIKEQCHAFLRDNLKVLEGLVAVRIFKRRLTAGKGDLANLSGNRGLILHETAAKPLPAIAFGL